MKKELELIMQILLAQPEYQRKQMALILICSTLTDISVNDAKNTYDKIKNILVNET